MDKAVFVQNIKYYCKIKGVKPTVACRESGVSSSFITNIESKGRVPSVERVQMLAHYLGVTVSELLGEPPPGGPPPEPLAADERQLVQDYRELSPQGQEYIRQTMHLAVQTYKKSPDLSKLEDLG